MDLGSIFCQNLPQKNPPLNHISGGTETPDHLHPDVSAVPELAYQLRDGLVRQIADAHQLLVGGVAVSAALRQPHDLSIQQLCGRPESVVIQAKNK